MKSSINTVVLPVAGLGTRFLPASKSIPKEMVTVVDRPAIEYVVKEAVAAGIEQIILVTHSSKASIENYFDRNFELETTLEQKQKFDLLKEITEVAGAPGFEERVRTLVLRELKGLCDEVRFDNMGNVNAVVKGTKNKQIMVAAHMNRIL